MVQYLSPRDHDKESRQPQLTLVKAEPGADAEDTIGGTLRRARLARGGQSLEAIASELCIRPHLLEALEQDDFDKLPGLIYASGFLRTYATWLGLDPAPLVERLKGSNATPVQDTPLVFPEPINDPRIPRRSLVVLAVILCLAVYGAWYGFSGSGDRQLDTVSAPRSAETPVAAPEPTPVRETPAAAAEADVPVLVAPAAPAQVATPAPAAVPGQLLLRASADSWIRITDANSRIIIERTLLAGETQSVRADAGYVLLAGNAGGLTIETGGKRYGPLGASGDVRRDLRLSPAALAAAFPEVR